MQTDLPNVQLRRYPFPFRAALAISNDTDGMDWAAFEDWHAFVCGSARTPYGDGLGLEVGDSFWVWSDTGAFALRHAPPWNDPDTPAPEAGRIIELARSGWLDTLHSFGDWNPAYNLPRDGARRGLEILADLDLRPSVYINHGAGLRRHNLGGPWASYQSGDDPGSEFYNFDLLRAAGFRFFWIDAMFENERFGENMDLYRMPPELRPRAEKRWLWVTERRSRLESDAPHRKALTGLGEVEAERVARHLSGNLLAPVIGRDDSPFWAFKRFRGHEAPNSASFALQASVQHLDLLESAGGACVVYQHFGVWRPVGLPKGHRLQTERRSPLLDDTAIQAFRDIATRQNNGRLFVTTTSRLLNYVWLRDRLRYSAVASDDGLTIVLEETNCPIAGRAPITADMLNGLAFLVPSEAGAVRLATAEGAILPALRKADPANPGCDAVYIPWRRLEFPACSSPPARRSGPDARAGESPPEQDQQIRHRALSARQARAMLETIEAIEKNDPKTLGIREDLRSIVPEWQSLGVPAALQTAADYVRKMHAEPFEAYHSRLQRLTGGGKVALDAGCGTATWSLPMAHLFEKIIAVDKNRSRVDFARWLLARSGCTRIEASYGDVTNLELGDNSVDFVFCYGVVISYLSMRAVLREFRRVTRPGGWIYLCVNGIGWSQHLRDDRGARSPSLRIQGQRGFYNTLCQVQQGDLNNRISRLVAQLARDEEETARLAAAAGFQPAALTGLLLSCHQAKTLEGVALPEPRSPERLARLLDGLLAEARFADAPDIGTPLVETLAEIERECGVEFGAQFGLDLVSLLAGRSDGFSYSTAGRGYTPTEIAGLCSELGLADFRWGGEGELVGEGGREIPAPRFFAAEYHGRLGVWEFLVRRQ
jgi:SAM-dependent methyltransferase